MEQNQPLFDLSLTDEMKSCLSETARWGRFLSIIGFIICLIIVLAGIVLAASPVIMRDVLRESPYGQSSVAALGPMIAVIYILGAVLYFFPCLYLMRYSDHMKKALSSEDAGSLAVAFQNLKSMFRFFGILTIIIIGFYVLVLVIGVMSAA